MTCGDLAELLESVRAPMSGSRFWSNLTGAVRRTRLEIPVDPLEAELKFCGPVGSRRGSRRRHRTRTKAGRSASSSITCASRGCRFRAGGRASPRYAVAACSSGSRRSRSRRLVLYPSGDSESRRRLSDRLPHRHVERHRVGRGVAGAKRSKSGRCGADLHATCAGLHLARAHHRDEAADGQRRSALPARRSLNCSDYLLNRCWKKRDVRWNRIAPEAIFLRRRSRARRS